MTIVSGSLASYRTLHVSLSGNDETANGSIIRPFRTVQAAVDFAKEKLAPSISQNSYVTVRYHGSFLEDVTIDCDAINLIGDVISASMIRSVTVTNATRESLAQYNVSGNYGDLVHNGSSPPPRAFNMQNVGLTGDSDHAPLRIIGVKGDAIDPQTNQLTRTAFMSAGANLINSQVYWSAHSLSAYVRNVNVLRLFNVLFNIKAAFVNVGAVYSPDLDSVEGLEYSYHSEDSQGEPSAGFQYGEFRDLGCPCGPLVLGGSVALDYIQNLQCAGLVMSGTSSLKIVNSSIGGDVNLNDTSRLEMLAGGIDGSVEAEAGATGHLKGTHVQGGLILAEGSGSWVMDSGAYMGTLVDPDSRLIHNLGHIGV